ncbi:hypothetical protein FVEN_g13054 [Fusarium venenatum]|nr:hypothetical protein FVEN_g13054 [Fusarium venenatum]
MGVLDWHEPCGQALDIEASPLAGDIYGATSDNSSNISIENGPFEAVDQ